MRTQAMHYMHRKKIVGKMILDWLHSVDNFRFVRESILLFWHGKLMNRLIDFNHWYNMGDNAMDTLSLSPSLSHPHLQSPYFPITRLHSWALIKSFLVWTECCKVQSQKPRKNQQNIVDYTTFSSKLTASLQSLGHKFKMIFIYFI